MAAASIIGFLKLVILADIFSAADFAQYSTYYGLAPLIGLVVSFGMVEGTVKRFTRLAVNSTKNTTEFESYKIVRLLSARYLGLAAVIAASYLFFPASIKDALAPIIFSIVISMGNNIFGIVASVIRARNSILFYSLINLFRAFFISAATLFVATQTNWLGALTFESIFGLAVISAIFLFIVSFKKSRDATNLDPEPLNGKKSGRFLFFGFLAISVSMTVDRFFISAFDRISVSALYNFMTIWLAGAYLLMSIFVQKFGPDMVRAQALDPQTMPLARTRRNAAALSGLLLCGTLVSFALVYGMFFETYWQKYGIDRTAVLFAGAAVALQVTPLYDWTLIALDGEKALMKAALINLAAVALGFMLCLWSGWGYPGYAASIVAGRLLQLAFADMAVGRLQTQNRIKAAELPE